MALSVVNDIWKTLLYLKNGTFLQPAMARVPVTGTDPEMQEVTLSFLHPRGPSRSFVYPHKADILTVHISDILTFVEPTTYTG